MILCGPLKKKETESYARLVSCPPADAGLTLLCNIHTSTWRQMDRWQGVQFCLDRLETDAAPSLDVPAGCTFKVARGIPHGPLL